MSFDRLPLLLSRLSQSTSLSPALVRSRGGDFSVAVSRSSFTVTVAYLCTPPLEWVPLWIYPLRITSSALFPAGTLTSAYTVLQMEHDEEMATGAVLPHILLCHPPPWPRNILLCCLSPLHCLLQTDSFSDFMSQAGNEAPANSKPSQKCSVFSPYPSQYSTPTPLGRGDWDSQSKAEVLSWSSFVPRAWNIIHAKQELT